MSLDAMTDADLVRLSVNGDCRAFEEIVRRNLSPVSAVAYAITGDRNASEDVAQEVFLSAWKCLKNLRDPDKLRAWLCVMAQNISTSLRRKLARDPLRRAADLAPALELASNEPSPSEVAVKAQQLRLVWSALEQVPEMYRVPLVLYYQQGQSISQVAGALGITEEAARQRLSRARTMLKREVSQTVERSLGESQLSPALVGTIMAGVAGGTMHATAAGLTTTAAVKVAGAGSGLAAAASVILVWIGPPLQILGGIIRGIDDYRSAQSDSERRLVAKLNAIAALVILGLIACLLFLIFLLRRHVLDSAMLGMLSAASIVGALLVYEFAKERHRVHLVRLLETDEPSLGPEQRQLLARLKLPRQERKFEMKKQFIERLELHPVRNAFAAHAGTVFTSVSWIIADALLRRDMTLLAGILSGAMAVEAFAVYASSTRPGNYLLHVAMRTIGLIALINMAGTYWITTRVPNVLFASGSDNLVLTCVLPLAMTIGFLAPAAMFFSWHRRMVQQRMLPDSYA